MKERPAQSRHCARHPRHRDLRPALAPFAWQQGKKAEALARSEGYDGEGLATAGKVLGIIGTAFLVITFVVVIILAASGNIGNS